MKTVIANWKLNPSSAKEAVRFFNYLKRIKKGKTEMVICPPFPYIPLAPPSLKMGAQNVFWESKGPYTGEVSPEILKSWKVGYAIVGHSERRRILGEKDEEINKKTLAILKSGLTAVLCVGESMAVRRKGTNAAKKFVLNQIREGLSGIPREKYRSVIIAYEPIWAISTSGEGGIDTPENAGEIMGHIKSIFSLKVIYGGSIDAKNAEGFLERGEIDGVLVGAASLDKAQFKKIVEIANKVSTPLPMGQKHAKR